MTDLETFGAHARAMSTAEHKPDCAGQAICTYASIVPPCTRFSCEARCMSSYAPHPDPECPGCVTSTDRALWARLADEVDDYMGRDAQEGLFG